MKLRVVDTDLRIAQQVTPENSVFSKNYPELSKFLYNNFDNVRNDYAIAMFNVELESIAQEPNEPELKKWSTQSPAHYIYYGTLMRNFFQAIRNNDGRVGTPLTSLYTAIGKLASFSTKINFYNDSIDAGFFLRAKSSASKRLIVVYPTERTVIDTCAMLRGRYERSATYNLAEIGLELYHEFFSEDGNQTATTKNDWIEEMEKTVDVTKEEFIKRSDDWYGEPLTRL